MEELTKQIIIALGAVVVALIGLTPVFFKRAQERRTRESLQALARTALDGWGDALNLLHPIMILESDDGKSKKEYLRLETAYARAWREYRGESPAQE